MRTVSMTGVGIALFGALQGPALADPALSTATLHRIEALLEPTLGPARVAPANAFAALEPLRPDNPGQCTASLAAPGNGRKLWAIYMIGTDLERRGGFATTNLNQLVAGWQQQGAPADADIFVAFGGAEKDGWRGVRWATMAQIVADAADGIYGNEPDSAYTFVDHTANMGAAATFQAFVDHAQQQYGQASRRFLSFWNHGASYNKTPGIGPDEVNLNRADMSANILDLSRINHVLSDSGSCWHMIGFDACLMASMQTARAVKDFGGYMLASEELEPGHGWNYQLNLDAWLNQPDVAAAGRAMVDAFVRDDAHPTVDPGKTLSLLDLSRFDEASAALSDTASLVAGMLAGQEPAPVIEAFANSARYSAQFSIDPSVVPSQAAIDAVDFLELMVPRTTNMAVVESLAQTIDRLKGMIVHSAQDGSRPWSNGVTVAPLDMNPTFAGRQVEVGLITPGWGELVATWDQMQKSALNPPTPLAIQTRVPADGLPFLTRWGGVSPEPLEENSLGAVGGFDSPWLMATTLSYGQLREDGSFLMLGDQETWPLEGGQRYAELWNGMSVHLDDAGQLVPVPVFHDGVTKTWASIVAFPDVDPDDGPDKGILMVFQDEETGTYDYGVAPILELSNGGWQVGRVEPDFLDPGDRVSFLSMLVAPDGEVYLKEVVQHVFTAKPTVRLAPLTGAEPVWALTGYTIADSGTITEPVAVEPGDRVFNWAQATYAAALPGVDEESIYLGGYYGRCDDAYRLCVAEKGEHIWYWDGQSLADLGPVSGWFEQARAAGY